MPKSTDKKMTSKIFFEKLKSFEGNPNIVFELQVTNQFKKSVDLSYSRNFNLQLLLNIIEFIDSR